MTHLADEEVLCARSNVSDANSLSRRGFLRDDALLAALAPAKHVEAGVLNVACAEAAPAAVSAHSSERADQRRDL